MKEKIKILLACEDAVFRDYLAVLLQTNPDFEITAQASAGRELIEQLQLKITDIVLSNDNFLSSVNNSLSHIKLLFPSVSYISLKNNCEIGVLFEAIRSAKQNAGLQAQ